MVVEIQPVVLEENPLDYREKLLKLAVFAIFGQRVFQRKTQILQNVHRITLYIDRNVDSDFDGTDSADSIGEN